MSKINKNSKSNQLLISTDFCPLLKDLSGNKVKTMGTVKLTIQADRLKIPATAIVTSDDIGFDGDVLMGVDQDADYSVTLDFKNNLVRFSPSLTSNYDPPSDFKTSCHLTNIYNNNDINNKSFQKTIMMNEMCDNEHVYEVSCGNYSEDSDHILNDNVNQSVTGDKDVAEPVSVSSDMGNLNLFNLVSSTKLMPKAQCVIAPNTAAFIEVEYESGEPLTKDVLIVEDSCLSEDLFIHESISNVDNMNVLVYNPYDSERIVERQEVIAQCLPIVEDNSIEVHSSNTVECLISNLISDNDIVNMINKGNRTNLSPDQIKQFHEIIINHKDALFTNENDKLGFTNIVKHKIELLDPNCTPIYQRPYRAPYSYRHLVEKEIEKLLNQGIIEESTSPWSSPYLLVDKKDNTKRSVVDFRGLNKLTKQVRFPIPNISDSLRTLGNSKIFSTIDLASGFFQVELDENSRDYTAFLTHLGQYRYRVMPMGLSGSPSTFQALMNSVLAGLPPDEVRCYLDDICISTETVSRHLELLQLVLDRISKANLKLKLKKCRFLQSNVIYLGHKIDSNGISVDPEKLEKLPSVPTPKNIKQVRSFLGLVGYYRSFIANFAKIARPLTDLTRKRTKFDFSEECLQSFNELKKALEEATTLVSPDYSKDFIIHSDASDFAVGAVLLQQHDNMLKPIEFASRRLSSTQMNYSVTEKEATGVHFSLMKFRFVITGFKTYIYTDHKPLKGLFKTKDLSAYNSRMARLILQVQQFNPIIEYIPGKLNVLSDLLSRIPEQEKVTKEILVIEDDIEITSESVRHYQICDEQLSAIRKLVYDSTDLSLPINENSCYVIEDDILFIKKDNSLKIVLPYQLLETAIKLAHSEGHFGINKTVIEFNKRFFIPKTKSHIQSFVGNCQECKKIKYNNSPSVPLNHTPIPPYPFHSVSMDFLGPFPKTYNNNQYVLVIVDLLSRFVILSALPNRSAEEVAKCLWKELFLRYSSPVNLLSDNAKEYKSSIIRKLSALYGVKKLEVCPYAPWSQGLCERKNQEIAKILRPKIDNTARDWDEKLDVVSSIMNSSYHRVIQCSPYQAVFGREYRGPKDLAIVGKVPNYNVEDIPAELKKLHSEIYIQIKKNIEDYQTKELAKKNQGKAEKEIKIGDEVFVKQLKPSGTKKKLASLFDGPYRCIDIAPTKIVIDCKGTNRVVHKNHIKVYNNTTEETKLPCLIRYPSPLLFAYGNGMPSPVNYSDSKDLAKSSDISIDGSSPSNINLTPKSKNNVSEVFPNNDINSKPMESNKRHSVSFQVPGVPHPDTFDNVDDQGSSMINTNPPISLNNDSNIETKGNAPGLDTFDRVDSNVSLDDINHTTPSNNNNNNVEISSKQDPKDPTAEISSKLNSTHVDIRNNLADDKPNHGYGLRPRTSRSYKSYNSHGDGNCLCKFCC